MNTVRIGTRKSPLAMAQAEWVAELIRKNSRPAGKPASVELVGIVTEGDKSSARRGPIGKTLSGGRKLDIPVAFGTALAPPSVAGGKGIFVKALDEALIGGKIDLAVHSAKDVPAILAAGLALAAILVREDVADLLITREGWTLENMPDRARVGTSSLRRSSQLKFYRPDVQIVPVRGNVETRLSKVRGDSQGCDAVIVAAAGINRLGGIGKVVASMGLKSHRLEPSVFLPAPGQGALMAVCRKGDDPRFSFLSDAPTSSAVRMERALVERLGADCNWPLGAWARRVSPSGAWIFDAAIFSVEGKLRVRESMEGDADVDSAVVGDAGTWGAADSGGRGADPAGKLAVKLLEKGGKKILEWNRERQTP